VVQPVKIGKSSLCVLIAFNSATCNGAQETKKHYRANNLNKAYEVMGHQKNGPILCKSMMITIKTIILIGDEKIVPFLGKDCFFRRCQAWSHWWQVAAIIVVEYYPTQEEHKFLL
jgi:hypothetical protein